MQLSATAATTVHADPVRGRREQMATRIAFFIAGFGMAAWAPLVPFAKARAGLDDGVLGLLLLGLGVGSITTMPLAGALTARFGCRRIVVVSTILAGLALPLLASVSAAPLLAAVLFIFGAGIGSLDVAMNIQAIIIERESGRRMMSGFHGLFSLGGIAGAAGVTALLGLGASPLMASLAAVAGMGLALLAACPHLLSRASKSEGPLFALPRGVVLLIGVFCLIVFMTEGAVLDWSAVFLASDRGVDPARAGLGYAAFALMMSLGRLTGDPIVQRFGGTAIIVAGGACAALGLALATLMPLPIAAYLGFALVGAGCSNIVPVLFSAVGRQTVMAETTAVPAITTLGYVGILAGPAAIGFVAQASSLAAALLILAGLLIGVAAGGRLMRI